MAKKIHCKHGLEGKEEIEARRLRRKLEIGDEELEKEIKALYAKWFEKPNKSFLNWLVDNDKKVLSSALARMNDWTILIA